MTFDPTPHIAQVQSLRAALTEPTADGSLSDAASLKLDAADTLLLRVAVLIEEAAR